MTKKAKKYKKENDILYFVGDSTEKENNFEEDSINTSDETPDVLEAELLHQESPNEPIGEIFHGTSILNAREILISDKLISRSSTSVDGRMKNGVFFTSSLDKSKEYGRVIFSFLKSDLSEENQVSEFEQIRDVFVVGDINSILDKTYKLYLQMSKERFKMDILDFFNISFPLERVIEVNKTDWHLKFQN